MIEPSQPVPTGGSSATRRLVTLLGVAAVVVGLDLGSKEWALDRLSRERSGPVPPACTVSHTLTRARKAPIVLIEGHVSLEYTENCGGAFGLLGKSSESLRFPFFVIVSIIAVGVIISVYRKLEPGQKLLTWALPLVLGGALGNFYDRIVHRYVVDFIKVQWDADLVWPTFNIADAGISVGVVLMLVDMIWKRPEATVSVPPAAAIASASAVPAPVSPEPAADAPRGEGGEPHGA
jgi:lipoprotein signal peptidase